MNATVTQLITAACVVVILGGLVWLANHYAKEAGSLEGAKIDGEKLAAANVEVAANLSVGDTADSLRDGAI